MKISKIGLKKEMEKEIKEMGTEFKDLDTTPTLTLDPFQAADKKETPAVQQVEEPVLDDSILTEEERQTVEAFAKQIDLTNSSLILQYGAGTQKKMADFSETALENVRTKDLGEVGEMLASVESELRTLEEEEEDKGFFSFFKKSGNKLANMKAKYEKAEGNVERICDALESHQIQLLKDIAMLDKMYELNVTYFKELSMYIAAGKRKLEEVRTTEMAQLEAKAKGSGLPEDAQAVSDLSSLCNRFEKKIHDLELTRAVSLQMAPQIRLVQSNDTLMSEKIQSTIVNTIPLWKSQMVLAIGVENSAKAAKAQREVTDMTNALLRKNAETLKMATIETAKETERGIVDMETLKATNESLIATLDEVMKIQTEGKEKRRAAEVELNRMEGELKQKLLEIH